MVNLFSIIHLNHVASKQEDKQQDNNDDCCGRKIDAIAAGFQFFFYSPYFSP